MTRSPILMIALLPFVLSCTSADGDDGAAVHAAYTALLDSLTGPTGYAAIPGARLTINAERSIATQPATPRSVITKFAGRGIPVVRTGTPLCPGEYRLAFGPAKPLTRHAYLIEVDVLTMSEYGFGDSEIFEYRVDCRTGSCAVERTRQLEQGEIAGGEGCTDSTGTPRRLREASPLR